MKFVSYLRIPPKVILDCEMILGPQSWCYFVNKAKLLSKMPWKDNWSISPNTSCKSESLKIPFKMPDLGINNPEYCSEQWMGLDIIHFISAKCHFLLKFITS